MDAERNRRNLRRVRALVKYGAVVMTAMGTIHCALLHTGRDHVHVHLVWCGLALVLGLYLNRLFGLCKAHLACILYIVALLTMMAVQRDDRHGWLIHEDVNLAMSVVGAILICIMQWKARTSC